MNRDLTDVTYLRNKSIDFRFEIWDLRLTPRINAGAWGFSMRFWIDSTDKSGGLYHLWNSLVRNRFEIWDLRLEIDPTDKCRGLRIFDLRFGIDSTDKSGGLYHLWNSLVRSRSCNSLTVDPVLWYNLCRKIDFLILAPDFLAGLGQFHGATGTSS